MEEISRDFPFLTGAPRAMKNEYNGTRCAPPLSFAPDRSGPSARLIGKIHERSSIVCGRESRETREPRISMVAEKEKEAGREGEREGGRRI